MRGFWIQKILALLFNLFILGLGLLLPNNDSLAELPKPYFDSLPVPNISGKVIGEVFADRDQVLWFNIRATSLKIATKPTRFRIIAV